jgi:hypothetical protein
MLLCAHDPVVEFITDYQQYFEEYNLLLLYTICFKHQTSHFKTLKHLYLTTILSCLKNKKIFASLCFEFVKFLLNTSWTYWPTDNLLFWTHWQTDTHTYTHTTSVRQNKSTYIVNVLKLLRRLPPGLTLINSTWCSHCVYVLCTDLRTNCDFCLIQHQQFGFV